MSMQLIGSLSINHKLFNQFNQTRQPIDCYNHSIGQVNYNTKHQVSVSDRSSETRCMNTKMTQKIYVFGQSTNPIT